MKVYVMFNDNELISIHRTLEGAQNAILKEVASRGYSKKEMEETCYWNSDKSQYTILNPDPNHTYETFDIWLYYLKD